MSGSNAGGKNYSQDRIDTINWEMLMELADNITWFCGPHCGYYPIADERYMRWYIGCYMEEYPIPNGKLVFQETTWLRDLLKSILPILGYDTEPLISNAYFATRANSPFTHREW
jgi:hypothetical protein